MYRRNSKMQTTNCFLFCQPAVHINIYSIPCWRQVADLKKQIIAAIHIIAAKIMK
jgi:hypothetical protein